MESIEKDYVIVNPHIASLEAFSDFFEASMQDTLTNRVSICPLKRVDVEVGVSKKTTDLASCHIEGEEKLKSDELEASLFAVLSKVQGVSLLHPSSRLELLHQYVQILTELSQEKVSLILLIIWHCHKI